MNVVTFAIPVFVALIGLELLAWRRGWGATYETRDTAASLCLGLGSVIAGATIGTLAVTSMVALQPFTLFDLAWTPPVLVACFLAEDLSFYWAHRMSHELRWFWASHVIHHSSQHFNLSTALRQPWTGNVSGAFVFYVPIVLVGFPLEMIVLFKASSTVYQFWIHTETIDRLGPLERVLNTPSHHRVHHASNPRYLDRNYAGVLIVWDRLFGSFVAERSDDPPVYGVVQNVATFNPLRLAVHEWVKLFGDLRRSSSAREALRFALGPPGWSPDGSRRTSAMIRSEWERRASGEPLLEAPRGPVSVSA